MYFRIYVIRDNGSEDTSLPFFVQSDVVAKRQFCSTLRTLPPSCRSDFQLEFIGKYDSSNCELKDNFDCEVVCCGSDDDIKQMLLADVSFYARGQIDKAPVNTPSDGE